MESSECGAEEWSPMKTEEKSINLYYFCIYWTEKSTLTELNTATRICCAPQVTLPWPHNQRRHARSGEVCDIDLLERVGKRRRGIPKSGNLSKWTGGNTETSMRDSRHRARWKQLLQCGVRTADRHSLWDREIRRSLRPT